MNITSCSPPTSLGLPTETINNLTKGIWRGVLNIGSSTEPLELPFSFEVIDNKKIVVYNGEERIEVTDIMVENDRISIKMPVFGSEFKLINKNQTWDGEWHNYNKKDYKIPFTAVANNTQRFESTQSRSSLSLSKRWQVTFSPNTTDSYPAIGLFDFQENGKTTGTFLTETGDYRYLEGLFDGETLSLSCFDGAHAFLFKATLQEDGSLIGTFWSGNHWQEPWVAVPSQNFQLAEMEKLTFLKEGYTAFEFAFPNASGEVVSLSDARFQGKATIVQITGSWCPNCMDETRFLVDIYNKYQAKGLEIVAIDYETENNFEVFKKSDERMRQHLGVNYPMLFGGAAKKKEAALTLPMLNHIMSYPTTIFIDKKGNVREIHTGFSGPGTGELYDYYVNKTTALVEKLIAE